MRTQSKTKACTKLPWVYENAGDQVLIGFSFTSDWCNFSGPIKQSQVKQIQWNPFDPQVKIT